MYLSPILKIVFSHLFPFAPLFYPFQSKGYYQTHHSLCPHKQWIIKPKEQRPFSRSCPPARVWLRPAYRTLLVELLTASDTVSALWSVPCRLPLSVGSPGKDSRLSCRLLFWKVALPADSLPLSRQGNPVGELGAICPVTVCIGQYQVLTFMVYASFVLSLLFFLFLYMSLL